MNGMDNGKTDVKYLTVPLCEKSFGIEASGDFTLADYQSEIRRILHVVPTVLPPAKYVNGGAAEFNGTVDYQVIYVGGDGGIYSVPLSSEYSFSVPFERGANVGEPTDVTALCSVTAESVNTRVSAPRRLSIKARLRPNVRIYGKLAVISEEEYAVNGINVYSRKENCLSLECESAESDVISVGATVSLPTDDARVAFADAAVKIGECDLSGSAAVCRGTVKFKLLCVSEESGELTALEAEAPFEGDIDIGLEAENAQMRVRGIVCGLSVNVGDTGIECNADIVLEALVCANVPVDCVCDVYSTSLECECAKRQTNVRQLLACISSGFTLSERIPLTAASIPEGAEITGGFLNVCMDKCTASDGKYVFGGNAYLSVLYKINGDAYSADTVIPVKYETDGAANEPCAFDACVSAESMKLRLSEESLCIDAELAISADCFGTQSTECISGVSFGGELPRFDSELVVCYPSGGDTLWSIAKRYGVPPTAISGEPKNDKYVIIEH